MAVRVSVQAQAAQAAVKEEYYEVRGVRGLVSTWQLV